MTVCQFHYWLLPRPVPNFCPGWKRGYPVHSGQMCSVFWSILDVCEWKYRHWISLVSLCVSTVSLCAADPGGLFQITALIEQPKTTLKISFLERAGQMICSGDQMADSFFRQNHLQFRWPFGNVTTVSSSFLVAGFCFLSFIMVPDGTTSDF